jgi:hypothetical protein
MVEAELSLPTPRQLADARLLHRLGRALALVAFAYPLLVVAALYGTWFVGWAALGHAPRPMLDDPKYIGWSVDAAYWVAMLTLMGAPMAIVLGAAVAPVAGALRAAPGWRRGLGAVLAFVGFAALWGATLWFLRVDPWGVCEWFMD